MLVSQKKILYIKYAFVQCTLCYILIGAPFIAILNIFLVYSIQELFYEIAVFEFPPRDCIFNICYFVFASNSVISHWQIFHYAVNIDLPSTPSGCGNHFAEVSDIKKSMVLKSLNVLIPVFYIRVVNLLDMRSIATVSSQAVQRSASILKILIRCLNPFILLLDKKELREIIYNKRQWSIQYG